MFLDELSMMDWLRGAYLLCVTFLVFANHRIGLVHVNANDAAASRRPVLVGIFLVASWAIILASRYPSFAYVRALNPDEALFAAHALRSRYGWLNWGTIDPLASGPLNSIVLTWPYLLGGDITLYSGRVTKTVLACATATLMFFTARQVSTFTWSAVAVVPCVLFYASILWPDFIHFNSEAVPTFLIALSIFLFVHAVRTESLTRLVFAALVVGLVPFAKLQGGPIAVAISALIMLYAALMPNPVPRWSRISIIAFAGVLPSLIFLLPLVLTGGFDDFVKSALVQPIARLGRGGGYTVSGMASRILPFVGLMLGTLLAAVVGATGLKFAHKWADFSRQFRWSLILSLLLLPASYIAIVYPKRSHYHYLELAIPALTLASIVSLSLFDRVRTRWANSWVLASFVCWLCAAPILVTGHLEAVKGARIARAHAPFLVGRPLTVSRPYEWLRPTESDSMVCWGWTPECYVDNALPSATRDGTNENQIHNKPLRPYFRERFMEDFKRSQPDFVVDLIAPNFFGMKKLKSGSVANFPDLMRILNDDFKLVSRVEPPDRCPRLYVRRARLDKLTTSLIAFQSIEAPAADELHSATAVDDRSVYDICDDFWLVPDKQPTSMWIEFAEPSRVSTIAILNTGGGRKGDRATRRVSLTFYNGARVEREVEFALKPFPWWTTLSLAPAINQADRVLLNVIPSKRGGGLNEIKMYRD